MHHNLIEHSIYYIITPKGCEEIENLYNIAI